MTTTLNHLDTVLDFINFGRIDEIRQAGKYVRPTVVIIQGTDQVSLSKGNDGKWRYGYHSTYGNGHFISGEGCDASGYVIKDDGVVAFLEGCF